MTHGQKVRNWILKAFEKEYPDMELISYTAEKHKIFSSYNVVIKAEGATENMVVHMSIYPDNPRGVEYQIDKEFHCMTRNGGSEKE